MKWQIHPPTNASVAELEYAEVLEASSRKGLQVQILPEALVGGQAPGLGPCAARLGGSSPPEGNVQLSVRAICGSVSP